MKAFLNFYDLERADETIKMCDGLLKDSLLTTISGLGFKIID